MASSEDLAQLLHWPPRVAAALRRVQPHGDGVAPELERLSQNLGRLVVTTSYSGAGSAEVALRMLWSSMPQHLQSQTGLYEGQRGRPTCMLLQILS